MRRRRVPRSIGSAMEGLTDRLAPATPLAAVQRAWPEVAGAAIAEQATPTALRAGVLTVSCTSAVWAQELELMAPELIARLEAAAGPGVVRELHCRATGTRGWRPR